MEGQGDPPDPPAQGEIPPGSKPGNGNSDLVAADGEKGSPNTNTSSDGSAFAIHVKRADAVQENDRASQRSQNEGTSDQAMKQPAETQVSTPLKNEKTKKKKHEHIKKNARDMKGGPAGVTEARFANVNLDGSGGTAADKTTKQEKTFPELFDSFITMIRNSTGDGNDATPEHTTYEARNVLQEMFSAIFKQHDRGSLPEEKQHFPTLLPDEMDGLLRLFWAQVIREGATCQQWKNRLRDLIKAIFGSRRSLLQTIKFRENELKVRATTAVNPWARNPLASKPKMDEDETMEDGNTLVRFRSDYYNQAEIEKMRDVYTEFHDFPSELRSPTDIEKKITQGLLEGNILAKGLPQFLKRTCNNDMLRAIQNTILAQVEGELYFQFPAEFPVYPDFQTRDRLVGAILQGAQREGVDQHKLTQMLGETKQVCYNSLQHSVHLFFWTRETATGWANVFQFIPFRNRRFILLNARPVEDFSDDTPKQRSARMWTRQVGSDGIRNEKRHERYRVKLLNVSRFMDEAALDAFIRSQFGGRYATFQEPRYGRQTFQTGAWEIFFRSPGCPPFLEKVKFINWLGKKILVHHSGINPAPPCYNCGVPGHTVVQCRSENDAWKRENGCITVTTVDIAKLEKHQSTVTSLKELDTMWETMAKLETSEQILELEEKKVTAPGTEPAEMASAKQPSAKKDFLSEWKTPSKKKSFRPGKTAREAAAEADAEFKKGVQSNVKDAEIIDLVEPSPEEENSLETQEKNQPKKTRTVLLRPDSLSRQNRLIMDFENKHRTPFDEHQADRCVDVSISNLEVMSGYDVLRLCGLNPVKTPATGNCQFYGVAMALLNKTFANEEDSAMIENMTVKLKKGMGMAAHHGFEVEFPHEIRKLLLSSQVERASELTIAESETQFRGYFEDVCKASSESTAFISRALWGSEVTLLMMAKLLQRPIYMMVNRSRMETASYQIFKPIFKTTATHELESAGEFNFCGEQAREWIAALQQDCQAFKAYGKLPIVLYFGSQHYTWLQFGEAPTKEQLEQFCSGEVKIINRDSGEDAEMTWADDSTITHNDRSEAPEQSTTDFLYEILQDSVLTEREKTDLLEIFKYGRDRQQDLKVFPQQGPRGLAHGLQKILVKLDWGDAKQVQNLIHLTGETRETLLRWQARLRRDGNDRLTSSEDDDVDMDSSETSEWSPEQDPKQGSSGLMDVQHNPDPGDPPDTHPGRFTGGGRLTEGTKRTEWNSLEERWKQLSSIPFPQLPVNQQVWQAAVLEHPTILMEWVQQVDSPEFILRTLNRTVILNWTRQFRIDCLLIGMTELQEEIERRSAIGSEVEVAAASALASWIKFIEEQRGTMTDDSYIHSLELWGTIKKLKANKVQLLQLCQVGKADRLARQLITAFVYAPELGQMREKPGNPPSTTEEYLKAFIDVLQSFPRVQRVYFGNVAEGDWAALESFLALQQEKVAYAMLEQKDE